MILLWPNNENLRINIKSYPVLKTDPERMTFREPLSDTLCAITPQGEAIPAHVAYFSKRGPDKKFDTTNINPNHYV